jgi:hypothetical protein
MKIPMGGVAVIAAMAAMSCGGSVEAPGRPQDGPAAPPMAPEPSASPDAPTGPGATARALLGDGTNGCDVCDAVANTYISELCTYSYASVAALGTECNEGGAAIGAACDGGREARVTLSEPADRGWRCAVEWPDAAELGRSLCIRVACRVPR